MSINYGGVYLCCPTAEVTRWIADNIPPLSSYQFSYPDWPDPARPHWPFPGRTDPRQVKLGSLFWPVGAQRWSVYYGLATDDMLEELRDLAYAGGELVPLTLRLDDGIVTGGNNTIVNLYEPDGIKTDLYMLPPMPLAQCSPHLVTDRMLYLLTLVDVRYFWWNESADIIVTGGTTTWEDLITSVGTAIGATITHTAIESEWLKPAEVLTSRYQPIPMLIDAIGACTGRKLVRSRDGTLTLQKPREAKTVQDAQLRSWPRKAGGLYHFNPDTSLEAGNDLLGLSPRQVDVVFVEARNGSVAGKPYKVSTTLASLSLTEYGSSLGYAGERVFHTTCIANFLGSSSVPSNATELDTLGQAIARDFYLWRLGRQDQVYAGICPYDPEGLNEIIEWTINEVEVTTRLRRGVWDDRIRDLLHHGTYGSSVDPGIPGINTDGVITITKNVVIEPPDPCSGPILRVTPPVDHPDTIIEIGKVPEVTPSGQIPVKPPIATVTNAGIIITPGVGEWPTPALSIVTASGYDNNPVEIGYSGFEPFHEIKPGGTTIIRPVLPTDPGLIIVEPPGYTDYPIYVEDPNGDKKFTVNASGRVGSGSIDTTSIVDGAILSSKVGSGQVASGHLASGLLDALALSINPTTIGTTFYPAGELLSGITLVYLTSDHSLRIAQAESGGTFPCIGVVAGSYVSGTLNVPVISLGRLDVSSGMDRTWSGQVGRTLFVGVSGIPDLTGGTVTKQRIGVGYSGGLYLYPASIG